MQFETKQAPSGVWFTRFAFWFTIVGVKDGKNLWVLLESYEQKNLEDHRVLIGRYHYERRSLNPRHAGSQPYCENSAIWA
jgi:hypothetical protein